MFVVIISIRSLVSFFYIFAVYNLARDIDMNDLDFWVCTSVLGMRATRDSSRLFTDSLIPGTRCILVVNRMDYIGFRFDRFAAGNNTSGSEDIIAVNHLNTMRAGT